MSADEKIYVDATQPAPTLHSLKPAGYANPGRRSGRGTSRSWTSLRRKTWRSCAL